MDGEIEIILVDGVTLDVLLSHRSLHDVVRDNLLIVTRNFNNRIRAMVKNIINGKYNPIHTTFYNYRVEFQVRGAPHAHGVLWINFEKMEKDIPGITECMEMLRQGKHLTNKQCCIIATFCQ